MNRMRLDVADQLDRAIQIIDKPEKWIKESLGKDTEGRTLNIRTLDKAVCYCAYGALHKAYLESNDPRARIINHYAESWLSGKLIVYNDYSETTHAQILDYMRAQSKYLRRLPRTKEKKSND